MQDRLLARKENADNRRYAPRYAVRLPANGSDQAKAFEVCIRSISATGISIEAPVELRVGSMIEIDLPGAGPTLARVMWSDGMVGGCVFETPQETSVVSATRLKSAPASDEPAAVTSVPAEVLPIDEGRRWPGAVRLAVALGAGLAAWGLVLTALATIG